MLTLHVLQGERGMTLLDRDRGGRTYAHILKMCGRHLVWVTLRLTGQEPNCEVPLHAGALPHPPIGPPAKSLNMGSICEQHAAHKGIRRCAHMHKQATYRQPAAQNNTTPASMSAAHSGDHYVCSTQWGSLRKDSIRQSTCYYACLAVQRQTAVLTYTPA